MLHRARRFATFYSHVRSRLRTMLGKRAVCWIELRYLPNRVERLANYGGVGEAIHAAVKLADRLDRKVAPAGRDRPVAVEVHTQTRMEAAISLLKKAP